MCVGAGIRKLSLWLCLPVITYFLNDKRQATLCQLPPYSPEDNRKKWPSGLSFSLALSLSAVFGSKLHCRPASANFSPEMIISTSQKIALVIIRIIIKFHQILWEHKSHSPRFRVLALALKGQVSSYAIVYAFSFAKLPCDMWVTEL